ncbi:ArsR family transcriptional regulator [Halorubrum ezzemoulense]|nr:ArsR family transcriptional regulator [Halorubrum ezzemoulense]
MRPLVSWMTKSDPAILELLHESDLELPPAVISHNVDGVSHSTVKRRLPILDEHELVEKTSEKRGYYRVTGRGRAYLAGDLTTADLEEK